MVTVDVHSHELARPFLVFATQNPVEYEGTYPLPEAQVDRFMVRLELGYPSAAEEAGMLAGHEGGDRVLELQAGRRPRRGARVPRTPPAASTPRGRCATTSSRCCATPAMTTGSSSAPRRAPA